MATAKTKTALPGEQASALATTPSPQNSYYGSGGNDLIYGSIYGDTIRAYNGDDDVYAGSGDDYVYGGAGSDYIYGENGFDDLYGDAGRDFLSGGGGMDNLYGGSGNDRLNGGAGSDLMNGGYGADVFAFTNTDVRNQDQFYDYIEDFFHSDGDKIDVSRIDAISGGSDNAFKFVGMAAFSGAAGELRYLNSGGNTFLEFDLNGDRAADYVIEVKGDFDLTSSDFIL